MPCSSDPVALPRIRLMGDSYAYASPGMTSRACRHAVTLLLAVTEAPVTVHWRKGALHGTALLVAPLVSRTLDAPGTPFVLVDLEPSHASFRRVALGCASTGVQVLQATHARALRLLAQDFHAGRLGGTALDTRLRSALTGLASAWPDPGPSDPRVVRMRKAMDDDPATSLGRLAKAMSMSPTRASRLFSAQMGIPARAYSMAAKVRAAARLMGSELSLTEVALAAGFADSAHFAKVWLRSYGAPPSRYFAARRTAMDVDGLPDWVGWRRPRPDVQASV
jgi:AraC-like DNA-binding protein